MNRLPSNGSISIDSVIQPSFGVSSGGCGFAPSVSHGTEEMSMVYRLLRFGYEVKSHTRVHEAPPLVLRKKMTSGHHEIWVATMMVFGLVRSIVSPLYPK